jgi:hypothetical protein
MVRRREFLKTLASLALAPFVPVRRPWKMIHYPWMRGQLVTLGLVPGPAILDPKLKMVTLA